MNGSEARDASNAGLRSVTIAAAGLPVTIGVMPYSRRRRAVCDRWLLNDLAWLGAVVPLAAPRAPTSGSAHRVLHGRRCVIALSSRGSYAPVEYLVRQARITDIDRFGALCSEMGAVAGTGTPLDAADLLRQLVYLPHASVLIAEARKEMAGGAVLALRPSIQAGGFVGTVDLLVVGRGHDPDRVTSVLTEEILRSAKNKGCVYVEVMLPDDPTLRARWQQNGFAETAAQQYRAGLAEGNSAPR